MTHTRHRHTPKYSEHADQQMFDVSGFWRQDQTNMPPKMKLCLPRMGQKKLKFIKEGFVFENIPIDLTRNVFAMDV